MRPPFTWRGALTGTNRRKRSRRREQESLGFQSLEPRLALTEVYFDPAIGQTVVSAQAEAGATQIVKRGLGALVLDRANTHTGGTVVEAGQLLVRNSSALGAGAVTVRPTGAMSLDVFAGGVSMAGLTMEPGSRLDFGYGSISIPAGGYSLESMQTLLQSGYGAGWEGDSGFVTRSAVGVTGGGLGYVVDEGGTLLVGFAATGDTNLDGVVDIMDIANLAASGKFDSGLTATWAEGDSNYDGLLDILDISDVLFASPFNAGPYVPDFTAAAQDVAGSTSTTAEVTVGSATSGVVGSGGDRNWYRVALTAGTTYRFKVSVDTLSEAALSVRDAAGTRLASTSDTFGITEIVFTAPTSGDYFLDVGGAGSGGGSTAPSANAIGGTLSTLGGGTIRATGNATPGAVVSGDSSGSFSLEAAVVVPDDDFTADATTIGSIAVGDIATGVIGIGGDRDWFRVSLKSGSRYKFNLDGNTLADPQLVLRSAAGAQLAANDDTNGKNSEITFTATATGDYFLDAGGTGSGIGSYTLTSADVTVADDYAANATTTGTVAVDGSATGVVNVANDRDWFGIPLVAGRTYRFTLDGTTLADPLLNLRSAGGTELASNDNYNGSNSQITYTAATTGTYYLDAGSYDDTTGAYRLGVRDLTDWDEFPGSFSTTGSIAVGGTVTSVVNVLRDRDWIVVNLVAGNAYRFNLDGVTLADPNLILWRWTADGGTMLAINNDKGGGSLNSEITWTALQSGPHYLDAGAFANGGIGSYTLTVTDISNSANDDFGASTTSYGTLAIGGSVPGVVNYLNDKDWFRVTLDAGPEATLWSLVPGGYPTSSGTTRVTTSRVADIDPTTLSFALSGGYVTTKDIAATVSTGGTGIVRGTGTLSFWVQANDGAYTKAVKLELSDVATGILVKATAAKYVSGNVANVAWSTTGTTGTVATSSTANGYGVSLIEARGTALTDAMKAESRVGRLYRFNVWGVGGTAGLDSNLQLLDSAGNSISPTTATFSDNWNILDPEVTYRCTTPGTYYLEVTAAPVAPSGLGSYVVTAVDAEVANDDYAGTYQSTGTVAVAGTAAGAISADGDRDWFKVNLEVGLTYQISVVGGTLDDPNVYLRTGNSLARQQAYNDNYNGRNSQITFKAKSTAAYFIDVGAAGGSVGSYTLSVTQVVVPPPPGDDFAGDNSSAGVVAIGGSVSGTIGADGDRDWFRVQLVAGRKYTFNVAGETLRDPDLYIRASTGSNFGYMDNTGGSLDPTSRYTPSSTGTYFIDVGAAGTYGTGTYTLNVTEALDGDDFGSNTQTNGRLALGRSLLGAIENYGDSDWFRVELERGTKYRFAVKGGDGDFNPANIRVHNSEGAQRAFNWSWWGSTQVDFTPSYSGTFYIHVGSYCCFQRFPYRVSASILSTPGADDFAGDATTAGGVSDQAESSGTIGFAGDRDWFRTYLVAGRTYQFDLKGSSLTDPSLSLRNATGRVVSTNDDFGSSRDSRILYTPTLSGTFFLDVGAGVTGTGIGTYTLAQADVSDLDRITGIQDVSIRTAVQTALADNLFSQQELAALLRVAGDGGVTAQDLADLQRIGISLPSFLSPESRSYLQYVFTAVVGGNRANQYWTGGTTARVALGDLQPGSTKEMMDLLVDKWFGGKDLPGNAISGDAAAGATAVAAFSYAPMKTGSWTLVDGGYPTAGGKTKVTALRVANLDPTKMTLALAGGFVTNDGVAAVVAPITVVRSAGVLSFWVQAQDDGSTKAVKLELTDVANGILVKATAARYVSGVQSNYDWNSAGTDAPVATSLGAAGYGVSLLEFQGSNLTGQMRTETILAVGGSVFLNGPSWDDIGQGAAGTCYLLAGLAAVAQARPDIVSTMFRDNGDGTYGVRFYGTLGSEIWVTVNSDIPVRADGITRLLGGDRSGSIFGEKWVALAEKAYAQANEIGLFSRPFAVNSYKAIEGGVQTALTHISGVPDRTFAFSGLADSAARENVATWDSYQSVVVQALASGSSGWIGSFGNRIDPWTGKRTFVSNHAYAIVGYDAQTDRFRISNPWGAGGGGWIGTFEVSWTDFRSFSCVVAIA